MLIPESALYPIALLIGLPIFILITCGYEGVKESFLFVVYLPQKVLALLRDNNGFYSFLKNIKFDKDTLKLGLIWCMVLIFSSFMSVVLAREWIINQICPFVIVVNDDSTEKVRYEVYAALGASIINGKTYKLNIGETLIVNESKKPLVYKTVKYTTKQMQIQRIHYWGHSSSSTIEPMSTLVVGDYPDYFFQSPPDQISSTGEFETIYVLDIDYNE
ncbi:MAG: hypothetical protein Q4C43_08240 [Prevotella sp.]|nr:hypothetical protein [Prevotella sp.]